MCEAHEIVLVEGVGGALVPINDELMMIDLPAKLGMPVLVVARAGLGTINHTLLTLEAIQMRGMRVAGVAFNNTYEDADDMSVETNSAEIERFAGVHMLGTLPFDAELSVENCVPGRLVESIEECLDVDGLIRRELGR